MTAKGEYGVDANAFTAVEFAPVKTMALRVEATMAADATVGLAEWRVGGDAGARRRPPISRRTQIVRAGRRRPRLDRHARERHVATVEIGDLAVPFTFAERTGARGDIYTRKLLRHALVAGTDRGSTGSAATATARTW